MTNNDKIWREYYQRTLSKKHAPRTEFAIKLNESKLQIAVDSGCGTGSDIAYMAGLGYQVHGFDINADAIAVCRKRFNTHSLIDISEASFEHYDYPKCGVSIANASLFFAEPMQFLTTWQSIVASLEVGGVFAGDFMGEKDSWAFGYRYPTSALTKSEVQALFKNFEIIRFSERDELGKTVIGKTKHWHTFSVVAVKRAE